MKRLMSDNGEPKEFSDWDCSNRTSFRTLVINTFSTFLRLNLSVSSTPRYVRVTFGVDWDTSHNCYCTGKSQKVSSPFSWPGNTGVQLIEQWLTSSEFFPLHRNLLQLRGVDSLRGFSPTFDFQLSWRSSTLTPIK